MSRYEISRRIIGATLGVTHSPEAILEEAALSKPQNQGSKMIGQHFDLLDFVQVNFVAAGELGWYDVGQVDSGR